MESNVTFVREKQSSSNPFQGAEEDLKSERAGGGCGIKVDARLRKGKKI